MGYVDIDSDFTFMQEYIIYRIRTLTQSSIMQSRAVGYDRACLFNNLDVYIFNTSIKHNSSGVAEGSSSTQAFE